MTKTQTHGKRRAPRYDLGGVVELTDLDSGRMKVCQRSTSARHTQRIFAEGDAARMHGIGKSSCNSWDFAERGDWIEARAEIVADEEAGRGMRLLNGKYAPWKQLLDFFSKFKRRGRIVFAIRP